MKTWKCGRWVVLFFLISRSVFAQIPVSVDSIYASSGDTVLVPVSVGDVTDSSIESYQFDFFFSDSVLEPLGATLEGTIAEDWGVPFVNMNNPGEIRIGAYGIDYLAGSGAIAFLKFFVKGEIGDSTRLEVRNFIFNNGNPEAIIHNGQLVVEKIVQLTLLSNMENLHVKIDAKDYTLPCTLNVTAFSSHGILIDSVLVSSAEVRYVFESRSDGLSIDQPVIVDSTNMELKISYKKQYYLTLQANYGHPVGEGWYDMNSMASFSIEKYDTLANSVRYHFLYWSGDTLLVSPNGTVKMDTSKTLMANFVKEIYIGIEYNRENAGRTIPPAPGIWVEEGEELTITAIPEDQYHFLSWGGDTSSTNNPLTFVVSEPFNVIAKFGNIFPVELAAWEARLENGNSVHLIWRTRSETNNYGFYIQRKDSSSSYTDIKFVKGNGTSGKSHIYSYIDENLQPGKYYYRLKQVDFSGKSHFSKVKFITISTIPNKFIVRNYPNPFNSSTTILVNLLKNEPIELSIFNLVGERVYYLKKSALEKGPHNFIWNGRSSNGRELPSGLYVLKVSTPDQTIRHKLILAK